jgi:hypothetical protein
VAVAGWPLPAHVADDVVHLALQVLETESGVTTFEVHHEPALGICPAAFALFPPVGGMCSCRKFIPARAKVLSSGGVAVI